MIIPFIFVLRRNLQETEEFANRKHRPTMREVLATLVKNWTVVIGGMLMVAMITFGALYHMIPKIFGREQMPRSRN